METFRRHFKVTLAEEDSLVERVEAMFRGLIEQKLKGNIQDLVARFLEYRLSSGDGLRLNYTIDISRDTLVALVGDIRSKKKILKSRR